MNNKSYSCKNLHELSIFHSILINSGIPCLPLYFPPFPFHYPSYIKMNKQIEIKKQQAPTSSSTEQQRLKCEGSRSSQYRPRGTRGHGMDAPRRHSAVSPASVTAKLELNKSENIHLILYPLILIIFLILFHTCK